MTEVEGFYVYQGDQFTLSAVTVNSNLRGKRRTHRPFVKRESSMADPHHLAKFREGVDAWNRWRKANPNVKPDLSDVDLISNASPPSLKAEFELRTSRIYLHGRHTRLMHQYLRIGMEAAGKGLLFRWWKNVRLLILRPRITRMDKEFVKVRNSLPDIYSAHLRGIDFNKANLKNANLKAAFLCEATMEGAYCDGANFEFADLRRADLRHARLYRANFHLANLSDSRLSDSNPAAANFSGALLCGVDLRRATGWEANFEGADFSFGDGRPIDPKDHDGSFCFIPSRLDKAIFSKANFSGSLLEEATMLGTKCSGANFRRADLTKVKLNGANLSECNLRGAILRNADLENVNLYATTYDRQARFLGARFTNCFGSVRFERFAKDQSYLEEMFAATGATRWLTCAWYIFADCGRTPWAWLAWCIVVVIGYGFIYSGGSQDLMMLVGLECISADIKNIDRTPLTPFYFSLVTFTTLGFGDVHPMNVLGEIIVATEVVLGYLMLGGLISIVSTIIVRRN